MHMNAKFVILGTCAALLLSFSFMPRVEAVDTTPALAASCHYAIVTGTSAPCAGTRTIGCSNPSFQCWIGTYCSVSGVGLLGCVGPAGAQCGPQLGGCNGYGGFYLPPSTPSFPYAYTCTAIGYGTDVDLSC